MPMYMLHLKYHPNAWQYMQATPSSGMCDRVIKPVVTKHGGKFHNAWLAFGEHDALAHIEMPNNQKAAAVSMQLSSNGLYSSVQTTPLIPLQEGRAALKTVKTGRAPAK